jgi:hypothetical protein
LETKIYGSDIGIVFESESLWLLVPMQNQPNGSTGFSPKWLISCSSAPI